MIEKVPRRFLTFLSFKIDSLSRDKEIGKIWKKFNEWFIFSSQNIFYHIRLSQRKFNRVLLAFSISDICGFVKFILSDLICEKNDRIYRNLWAFGKERSLNNGWTQTTPFFSVLGLFSLNPIDTGSFDYRGYNTPKHHFYGTVQ